jgi:phosphotransferase system  glucose/maltose/N-acetylglucosamine-specific IIC component
MEAFLSRRERSLCVMGKRVGSVVFVIIFFIFYFLEEQIANNERKHEEAEKVT